MSLSTNLAYDRLTRMLGSAWFLLLALAVSFKLATPAGEPWPSLVSNFFVAVFYLMLALLILIRGPAKAQAERAAGYRSATRPNRCSMVLLAFRVSG